MKTKKCCVCKIEKSVEDFGMLKSSKDGYRYDCKDCKNARSREYREKNKTPKKTHYTFPERALICVECGNTTVGSFSHVKKFCSIKCSNKNKNSRPYVVEQKKRYLSNNIDKRKKTVNESKLRNYYKPSNVEKREEYYQRTDIRLKNALRSRIKKTLKTNPKKTSTLNIVGCTLDQLKQHIESKFKFGMTWHNWGSYGWHLDHIIPLSSASNPEEMYKLCHFSNLQPLWWYENLSKSNKIFLNED